MGNSVRYQLKKGAGQLCVLALALCSFNCMDKPLAPVAPTWETQLSIPLSMRSYTLADLIAKNSSLISIAPGGTLPGRGATFQTDRRSSGSTPRLGGQVPVAFPSAFSPAGGQFSDTVSIGDTSGSGQKHTLVDQKTAGEFNSIKIHVVVDNGIPFQVALKLHFLDMEKKLLINIPQTSGDSITVPAPALVGGAVQSPSHVERIIELADTDIQKFNNAYSLVYFLQISTDVTDIPALEPSQIIDIRVWAEFSYQVNK